MKNKKTLLISILSIVILTVIAVTVLGIYKYNENNRIGIAISPMNVEDDGSIMEGFVYSYGGNISDKNEQNLMKVLSDTAAFKEEFYNSFEAPYNVELTIETKNRKTIVTYKGTATNKQTKEVEPIEKILTYDFVLIRYDSDLQRAQKVDK